VKKQPERKERSEGVVTESARKDLIPVHPKKIEKTTAQTNNMARQPPLNFLITPRRRANQKVIITEMRDYQMENKFNWKICSLFS